MPDKCELARTIHPRDTVRAIHKPADGAALRVVAAVVLQVRRLTEATRSVNSPNIE